eukprot:NODE_11546_length_1279_cov_6.123264.p1 GENE.NODE_11546_length_1279_cov_6.123264~~NODE_11546_length_1279_cov_6.123264.p1  ORF type:complete len:241 (+),score=23.74 NODE_11546_length_1279_cov_6.123264:555-1277(+)
MCLVLKPPGWEVDTEGEELRSLKHLSGFLQATLPSNRQALAFRPDFSFGFIHRLDTPSSGLVLTATSFAGYCALEWQMYTYEIGREYHVVGHGAALVGEWCVAQRILDVSQTVRAAENGRPAQSHLRFVADMGCPVGAVVCHVCIRIYTGRRHQIRVHMQWCDCPSVSDHRYGTCPTVLLYGHGGRSSSTGTTGESPSRHVQPSLTATNRGLFAFAAPRKTMMASVGYPKTALFYGMPSL